MDQSQYIETRREEAEDIFFSDTGVRSAVEAAFSLYDKMDLPPSIHLLFLFEHLQGLKKISLSFGRLYAGKGESADEEKLVREWALQMGLIEAEECAFASALTGEPMPRFQADASTEQKAKSWRDRKALKDHAASSDSPLRERLDRIMEALKDGRDVPAEVWSTLLARDVEHHLDQMTHDSPAYSDHLDTLAQQARNHPSAYWQQREDIISELARLGGLHTLMAALHITPSEERASEIEDLLWKTDEGADWWIDKGWDDLDELRQEVQGKLKSTLLRLLAWEKVRAAIQEDGDARQATAGMAPQTARHANPDQRRHLDAARDRLQSDPDLRTAKQGAWRDARRKSVVELAHDCLGTSSKKEWPEVYRGFQSRGFATLVEDLWDGSWTTRS